MKAGYRTRKRQEKRKKKIKKTQLYTIVAVILALAVIVFILKGYHRYLIPSSFKEKKKATKEKLPPAKATFLMVGVKEETKGEKADSLAMIYLDTKKMTINGIAIPEDTFVPIPGPGFDKIGAALKSGSISNMKLALENMTGLKIDFWIEDDYRDLNIDDQKASLEKVEIIDIFKEPKDSSLNYSEMQFYLQKLKKIKPSNINMAPLPVRPIVVGDDTFYEPKKDEMNKLIEVLWGVKSSKKKEPVRVVVLNGSGVPGAGGDVAELLINNGYKVVDIKNASTFDYKKTQIISYIDDKKQAENIKSLLKTGIIIRKDVPQDLTELTIVVGKDYKIQKK